MSNQWMVDDVKVAEARAAMHAVGSHTLGPWKAIKEGRSWWVRGCGGWLSISVIGREEAEANAHLIAAAPELLDALKKAYAQCVEFLNEGDFKRNVEWDAGYIVDAIAKAEGRDGA